MRNNRRLKVVCVAVLLYAALAIATEPKAETTDVGQPDRVRALLVPQIEATLSSDLRARISHLDIKAGERFEKGKTLVRFDCAELAAKLKHARAEYDAAVKVHESNQQLASHKAVSNLDLELSEIKLLEMEAKVELNAAQVRRCTITAPFNGRVVKRHVNRYDTVDAGVPLLDVLDDSQLEILMHVSSDWLRWLKTGVKFSLEVDETGTKYPATIVRLGARIDAVSRTIEAVAKFDEKFPALLAGMSGVAKFKQP